MHTEALKLHDHSNGSITGHWKLSIYEGEIRRSRISLWKRGLNWILTLFGQLPKYLWEVMNSPLQVIEGFNLVTTTGKGLILDRLFALSSVAAVSRIGVGTSGTAAAIGNTALTSAVFKAFDVAPTRSGTTITCQTTFWTSDANINWQELGMDNGTTLLNRIAPIGPINKTTAISIIVQVAFTQN